MEGGGGEGVMEGQMEGKKEVVLATHFVRGQPFSLVSGCLRSWVVVLDGGQWSLCLGGGSCPGRSSFALGGCCHPCCHLWSWLLSLGLGCRLWAPHRRSWVVGLICGWCTSFVVDVRGLWLSYTRGVGAVMDH